MKYFGTDGIRGLGNKVKSLAFPLGVVLGKMGQVVVARDTRPSSFDIERELARGLLSAGAEVKLVGVVPTPALHYLAKYGKVAVMITASHNPPEYNGLKVIVEGGKLSPAEEEHLDNQLDDEINNPSPCNPCGRVEILSGGAREYKRHVIGQFDHLNLSGLGKTIYIDTAHGCFSYIAKDVLETLGGDVVAVNNDHDGDKVNVRCGALYVEDFAKRLPSNSIGFAFDGDGDRVMAVIDGRVFDGDQMLYNIARHKNARGKVIKEVVGTIMTNGGIERALSKEGVSLVRTDVGDKHVLQAMKEKNLLLGGEKSGHLIIGDKSWTGDGIVTALSFLEVILGENIKKVREFKTENYALETEKPMECYMSDEFQKNLAKTREEIGENARLIVRPSGTEDLIRITVEHSKSRVEYGKIVEKFLLSKTYKNRANSK